MPTQENTGHPLERPGADALHTWWELSYAAYLVLPRSLLQSMPDEWQGKLAALLKEAEGIVKENGVEWPPEGCSIAVSLRDARGRFTDDYLCHYDRGCRRLW